MNFSDLLAEGLALCRRRGRNTESGAEQIGIPQQQLHPLHQS